MFLIVFACFIVFGVGGDFFFVLVSDEPDKHRWTKTQADMGQVAEALRLYAKGHGSAYPESLRALEVVYFPNGIPKDWFTKEDYGYERIATGFRLTCLGKDEAEGGADIPDRDIIFDETGQVAP